jgi:hypothetical protein
MTRFIPNLVVDDPERGIASCVVRGSRGYQ